MPEHKEHPHHIEPASHDEKTHHEESAAHREKEIKISLPAIKGTTLATITAIAAVLLFAFVMLQAIQTYSLLKKLDASAAEAAELSKPAELQLVSITAECSECVQLSSVQSAVEAAKVNITKKDELKASDTAAKELIAKYGVKRLPTIILTGETGKATGMPSGFTKIDDALIFTGTTAPYVDATTGKTKGLVTVTYINATGCKECPDLVPLVQQLESQAKVASFRVLEPDSAEAKKLIEQQSVKRLPALFLSEDIMEYPVGAQLASAGATAKNGLIPVNANPPYINVSTGKAGGIAQIILLNDSSCKECYDVLLHEPIVKQRFQVYVESTRTVDVASTEGKALVLKYKILAVPTILIAGDAAAYDGLTATWQSVGSVESDGTYIFRAMSAIAGSPYRNLTTGKIELNPAQ